MKRQVIVGAAAAALLTLTGCSLLTPSEQVTDPDALTQEELDALGDVIVGNDPGDTLTEVTAPDGAALLEIQRTDYLAGFIADPTAIPEGVSTSTVAWTSPNGELSTMVPDSWLSIIEESSNPDTLGLWVLSYPDPVHGGETFVQISRFEQTGVYATMSSEESTWETFGLMSDYDYINDGKTVGNGPVRLASGEQGHYASGYGTWNQVGGAVALTTMNYMIDGVLYEVLLRSYNTDYPIHAYEMMTAMNGATFTQ